MRGRLRGAARRLGRDFFQGLTYVGLSFFPGAALLIQQGSDPADQPPAGGHPERVVPFAELSEDERRFWNRLADRVGKP
jgi:hypothetical protein